MRCLFRTITFAGVVALLLLAQPSTAFAAETAASEIVIIREGDTVVEDLYAAGVRVVIEGRVEGDLVAFAAEEVLISGEVTGSVLAIAPSITIDGDIGESARLSGGGISVTGSISGDLVAAVVSADLDSGSDVSGDVMIWGIDASVSGRIGGDLSGSQRTLALAGSIEGDVDVNVGRLTVAGPLEVTGDLGYRSSAEAEGLEQATVGGVVVRKTPVPPNIRVRALGVLARFLVVLGLTTTALLVAWGWTRRTRIAGDRARAQPLRSLAYGAPVVLSPLLLAGVAALIAGLAPAAASLPLLAIFGPLIVATSGIVLVSALVAGVPVVLALGRLLPGNLGTYTAILAGSVVVGLLWLIPWAGWVIAFLVQATGLGAWFLGFREKPQPEPA